MQVWNALHAARCKYRTQKNRHLGTIAQLCWAISSQLRHAWTIGKNLLSSNTSSTYPDNMVNFGLLTAEICSGVWSTLQISTGFASWQHYCMHSSRGRHLYLAGRPSRWALAHISSFKFTDQMTFMVNTYKQELSSCWDGRPFGHNRHGPKSGEGLLWAAWVPTGSPSNIMWPEPRLTSLPSGILIHPTVWLQL